MFSSFLCPPLVALVAYVVVVSSVPSIAPPSLTVKASASDLNIDGLGNLKVTTTVVNTGGESLKLLNDPRGVLDSFPENSFTFARSPSGSRPSFVGARVNHTTGYVIDMRADVLGLRSQASYNSTLAAGLDDPSAFTVLAPGGSVNVTHNREWIVSIGLPRRESSHRMMPSLGCLRLHPIWHRRILNRTVKPLHVHRWRRDSQGLVRHCWGYCQGQALRRSGRLRACPQQAGSYFPRLPRAAGGRPSASH